MPEESMFPDFEDDIDVFFDGILRHIEENQNAHLRSSRNDCEIVVKAYWHTYMIARIIVYSFLDHHIGKEECIREWLGIWTRFIDSLNLLRDSLVLGLQGRIIGAAILLRPALESIITGAFYNHLSQAEFRERAKVLKGVSCGENNELPFLDVVEKAIENIEDNDDISFRLENEITKLAMKSSPELRLPKYGVMVRQLVEWGVPNNEPEFIVKHIHGDFFNKVLSGYAHSLLPESYLGRGEAPDVALSLPADKKSIQEYTRIFQGACIIILLYFLGSTEDMQKTREFSEAITKYLQNNPNADSVLASIPDQILESIEENDL